MDLRGVSTLVTGGASTEAPAVSVLRSPMRTGGTIRLDGAILVAPR